MSQVTVPTTNTSYLERQLLMTATPKMFYDRFGKTYGLPLHNTDQVTVRKYFNFDEETTSGATSRYKTFVTDTEQFKLGEAIANAGGKSNTLKYEDMTGQVVEIGGDFTYTTRMRDFNFEDPVDVGTEKLGKQAGLVTDAWFREQIVTNTALTTGNVFDVANATVDTLADISNAMETICTTIDDYDIERVTKIIMPTPKVTTKPVDESFWGITDPIVVGYLTKQYNADSTKDYYLPVKHYSETGAIPGEVGRLGGVRLLSSSHAHRSSNATASHGNEAAIVSNGNTYVRHGGVHHIIVYAAETYASITLRGKNRVRITHHEPGSSGVADKHNREGSIAWDSWLGFIDLYSQGRGRIAIKIANA